MSIKYPCVCKNALVDLICLYICSSQLLRKELKLKKGINLSHYINITKQYKTTIPMAKIKYKCLEMQYRTFEILSSLKEKNKYCQGTECRIKYIIKCLKNYNKLLVFFYHLQMRPFLPLLAALLSVASGQSSSNGCALIVSGPPRSSNFDHGNRAFGGPPAPFNTDSTCLTYDAVNAAFEQVL